MTTRKGAQNVGQLLWIGCQNSWFLYISNLLKQLFSFLFDESNVNKNVNIISPFLHLTRPCIKGYHFWTHNQNWFMMRDFICRKQLVNGCQCGECLSKSHVHKQCRTFRLDCKINQLLLIRSQLSTTWCQQTILRVDSFGE